MKINEITQYYIFKFLIGINLIEGIFILFLLSLGLNYTQVLITQSIYALSLIIFQIPAGFLSDTWSRKNVIIIGSLIGIFGSLIYAMATNFYQIIFGEMLFGIAIAFSIGTFSSFAYDTLIELGMESKSKEIFSKGTSYTLLAGAIAPSIGGLVVKIFGIRWGMMTNAFSWFLVFVFSIFIKEPKIKRVHKNFLKQLKESLSIVRKNRLLITLIINSVIIGVGSWIIHDLMQSHFNNIGFNVFLIGIIFSAGNLFSAIISRYSYFFEKKFGTRFTIIYSSSLITLGSFIVGSSQIPLLLVLGFLIIRMFTHFREPLFENYINQLISSEKRATILSFSGFLYWFLFGLVGLWIGFFIDIFGLQKIFLSFSIIMGIVSLLFNINEKEEKNLR